MFDGGRTQAQAEVLELDGIYPEYNSLMKQLVAETDDDSATVTVAYSAAVPPRSASWRKGQGCTLRPIGWALPKFGTLSRAKFVSPLEALETDAAPWPQGDIDALPKKAPKTLAPATAKAFVPDAYGANTRTTAVVVVSGGKIAAEQYADGFTLHTAQRTWSVAKSLTATLIGVVAQQGWIRADNYANIPEWDNAVLDPRRNITVDHLDRHGSVEGYRKVKRLLADRVDSDGVLIVNLDDPVTASLAGIGRVSTVGYRRDHPVPGGVGIVDGWIVAAGVSRAARFGGGVAGTGPGGRIMPVDEIALPGDHSISNVLAAICAGLVAGVAPDAIRAAVAGFRGIPHRLETVAVLDGIRYVNDAQATQPDAVAAAVRSFRKPLVLLAGGRSKGLDLTELAPIIAAQCSGTVLFGELADELEVLFRSAGLQRIDRATSIPDAAARGGAMARTLLDEAKDLASTSLHESEARATVLLSPIGSSFDMFNNPFGARGDAFRAAVLELPAEHRA
jgi:hypothetical protein